ncbi:hypothetical protein DAPPUDRAFT_100124 [Daphnia pulex]|uniref:Uncharacterized protein n=1 Tax=Daphnia pulex TaxID=6669 RepID=E9G9F6_DAPPU|nr:hypothetical protein DAPPUDRAFT_100124 [Daphnia pulex]|eukprot:EFX83551.1 hypothetical protein DAPPUDRAFT_100124 [Daphnia pulex]
MAGERNEFEVVFGWGALLEWVKNEESEVSDSGLLVSFLVARAPFLPAASNEFSFDSVASLFGLIVPTCLRPEDINPNRKIMRETRLSTQFYPRKSQKSVAQSGSEYLMVMPAANSIKPEQTGRLEMSEIQRSEMSEIYWATRMKEN